MIRDFLDKLGAEANAALTEGDRLEADGREHEAQVARSRAKALIDVLRWAGYSGEEATNA